MNAAWEWNDINEQKAKRRFGIKHYRAGQRKLIQAVVEGKNALGILPTGGGKSLCYQLPALFLPRAVLVISPLISLIQDQQEKLSQRSIPATELNSTLNSSEEQENIEAIQSRQAELIYVTPERLENGDYLKILKKAACHWWSSTKLIAFRSGAMTFVRPTCRCVMRSGTSDDRRCWP